MLRVPLARLAGRLKVVSSPLKVRVSVWSPLSLGRVNIARALLAVAGSGLARLVPGTRWRVRRIAVPATKSAPEVIRKSTPVSPCPRLAAVPLSSRKNRTPLALPSASVPSSKAILSPNASDNPPSPATTTLALALALALPSLARRYGVSGPSDGLALTTTLAINARAGEASLAKVKVRLVLLSPASIVTFLGSGSGVATSPSLL